MSNSNFARSAARRDRRGTMVLYPKFILIGIALLCAGLTGIFPQRALALTILVISCMLVYYDAAYLLYPIMIFYSSQLGLLLGVSTYRLYTCVLLCACLIKGWKKATIQVRYTFPLIVYMLYSLLVIFPRSSQRALFTLIDIICCLIVVGGYLRAENNLKKFFKVYVLVALLAFITGALIGNEQAHIVSGGREEFSRFMATFEDPNYMGFFYTIAIFSLITLKLFKPTVRFVLIVVLYGMLLTSASITAILANMFLWLLYLVVTHKINGKTALACIMVAFVLFGLYQYGLDNPGSKVFGTVSFRIQEKLAEFGRGNTSAVTTGRTDLSEEHLELFESQSIWKQLVGGTEVNTYYISPNVHGMAHNEYVDMLLNVGIIGTAILIGFAIASAFKYYKSYKEYKNDIFLFKAMCKGIWLFYVASLTIFLDHRFLVLYFL